MTTRNILMASQLGLRTKPQIWLLMLGVATAPYTATATQVFLETMATNASKPWMGARCDNARTVTFSGGNPFEQAVNANYGPGNPCGLTIKNGTTSLSDSVMTSTGRRCVHLVLSSL